MSMVTLPPNVSAQIGPDFSPIRVDLLVHADEQQPCIRREELKSLQDWVISKYMKSVPDVVDDSSSVELPANTRFASIPTAHRICLSIGQVEQQLTNANANAGGSFIEQGAQQINVRAVGLVTNINDIAKIVPQNAERHGIAG